MNACEAYDKMIEWCTRQKAEIAQTKAAYDQPHIGFAIRENTLKNMEDFCKEQKALETAQEEQTEEFSGHTREMTDRRYAIKTTKTTFETAADVEAEHGVAAGPVSPATVRLSLCVTAVADELREVKTRLDRAEAQVARLERLTGAHPEVGEAGGQ